jgi:hypothetical protein
MSTTTIPVTIQPDAAAHVASLGMQSALQTMLDHTLETVPGIRQVQVSLDYDPCEPDDPRVVFHVYRDHPGPDADRTDWDWGAWCVATFPPEVFQHFSFLSWYGAGHGR